MSCLKVNDVWGLEFTVGIVLLSRYIGRGKHACWNCGRHVLNVTVFRCRGVAAGASPNPLTSCPLPLRIDEIHRPLEKMFTDSPLLKVHIMYKSTSGFKISSFGLHMIRAMSMHMNGIYRRHDKDFNALLRDGHLI